MPQAGPVFNNSSRVPNVPQPVASVEPPRATARREMRGPTGVDDILKTFAEVRQAEVMEASMPSMSMMGGGMMGGGPTLASDIQSVQSEEIRSQGDSVRTAGGGRRKKRNTPILGNELSLNV